MPPEDFPARLSINAWAGGDAEVTGAVDDPIGWSYSTEIPAIGRTLFADQLPDFWDWRDPRVGWGVILPENESLTVPDRARAVDAPEPLHELLADRPDAPVFRYRPDSPNRWTTLMRYFSDATALPPHIGTSGLGVGREQIPYYLLICASPADIPWEFQYLLNTRFAVGRLDLDDEGLSNYITALRCDWANAKADPFATLVWATDHGGDDMSGIMRRYIARPLFDELRGDQTLAAKSTLIDRDSGGATAASLMQALTSKTPGLIVTTSHGVTNPVNNPAQLATSLGLLVDEDLRYAAPAELLARWEPDGAIWYAHACCSAGASAHTVYGGLPALGSDIMQVLTALTTVGSLVAPLPEALLGARHPARAFIGHVEPTFDYTIREPETRQSLTDGLCAALHGGLYQETHPGRVGQVFHGYFEPAGTAASQQIPLKRSYDKGENVGRQLLAAQLMARDRLSTVILGDPTVRLTWPSP
jgi:hypothetical protein